MESFKKLKPSKLFYLLGALVIVAGVICSIAITAGSALATLSNGKEVQVPGTSQLNLDKTGVYSMMYDYDPSSSSKTHITDFSKYSGLNFTIKQVQGGNDIAVTSIASSVLEFKITQTGTYTLSGAYGSGKTGSPVVMLVVSPASLPGTLIAIIFIVGVCGGLAIIMITSIKRKRNKKLENIN